MELKWLQDFISLANTGSFSEAADNRHVTQSAFSRRIKALENWLGTTLVDRTTHPITLTDSGYRFVETANQIILTLCKVREDFNTNKRGKSPTLTLGVANHLSIHFFPPWLHEIEEETGNYNIQLVTSIKAGVGFFESLKRQEYDFLLAYGGSVSSIDHDSSKFEALKLGKDYLVPVCKTSLLDTGNFNFPGTPDAPLPHISYMMASTMTNMINTICTQSDCPIYLQTRIETGTAETIKALVLEGFGMAWLPRSAILNELAKQTLKEMGDSHYQIPLTIELFRYIPNTKPEIIVFWDKLKAKYNQ